MSKKDSLIKGTLILALAAVTVRFMGLAQRVPLTYLLEQSGNGTFSTANNIYLLLLTVATAGIPSTLSKMVSERTALGQYEEADRIFKASIRFSIVAGIVMTLLLFFGAPYYVSLLQKDTQAVPAIQALAPALLLFPAIAMMRGYFQGRQMMTANGMSQIVEQILRVVGGIGIAAFILYAYQNHVWAIAGASFGGVLGSIGAFAVMYYAYVRLKKSDRAERNGLTGRHGVPARQLSNREIYRRIFNMSIPITLISLAVPLANMLDTSTMISILQVAMGHDAAKHQLDILSGQGQMLAGIPIILATALSQSIVPIISSAYARNDRKELNRQASLTFRLAVISGLPAVILLSVAARPINGLLFKHEDGHLLVTTLMAGTIFQIVMMTSGAILMGLGKLRRPMIHVMIGAAVKLLGNYALAPTLGEYAFAVSTDLAFFVIMMWNMAYLYKTIRFKVLGRRWPGMIVTIAALSAVGVGLELLTHAVVHTGNVHLDYFIQLVIVSAILLPLYPLLLAATRVVTKDDLASFPAPIKKIVNRVSGKRGRNAASN